MHHAGKIAGAKVVTPDGLQPGDEVFGPYIVRPTPAGNQVLRHAKQVIFLPAGLWYILVEALPEARLMELLDQMLLSTVAAKRDGGRDATAKLQRELRSILGMH